MVNDDDMTVLYRGPVPQEDPWQLAAVRGAAGQTWAHPSTASAPLAGPHVATYAAPVAVEQSAPPLFRAEAMQAYQQGDSYGSPLRVVPTWMVWSVRVVVLFVLATLAFAALAEVSDYARGPAVIRVEGRRVIGATTAGNVAHIAVNPGQRVEAGDILLRFDDSTERAEFERIEREHELLLARLLRDPKDSALRQQMAALDAQRVLAQARLDERTIRAPIAGVTSDVRVHVGQHAKPGEALLAVDDESAEVVVVAMVPGHHRPRLSEKDPQMTLELAGFDRERIPVRLRSIADEVVGPGEALRFIGDEQTGAIAPSGPVVIVEATLPKRTFESEGDEYRLYDGMQGELEAELDRSSLLRSLVPYLDQLLGGDPS